MILSSRKPEAVALQYWMCEEVLPQLRATGHHSISDRGARAFDAVADLTGLRRRYAEVERREIDLDEREQGLLDLEADASYQYARAIEARERAEWTARRAANERPTDDPRNFTPDRKGRKVNVRVFGVLSDIDRFGKPAFPPSIASSSRCAAAKTGHHPTTRLPPSDSAARTRRGAKNPGTSAAFDFA